MKGMQERSTRRLFPGAVQEVSLALLHYCFPHKPQEDFPKEHVAKPTFLRKTFLQTPVNLL